LRYLYTMAMYLATPLMVLRLLRAACVRAITIGAGRSVSAFFNAGICSGSIVGACGVGR
jgi:hypothetical protein